MGNRPEILLVGSDLGVLTGLCAELRARAYGVTTAARGDDAFAKAVELKVDVVVSQLLAPDLSGLELLARLHPARPCLPVILLTDAGTPGALILAGRLGVYGFLVKPFPMSQVLELIQSAVSSNTPGLLPLAPGEAEFAATGLIGMSGPMQELYKQLGAAAESSETVLIHGATGTGKELVARAIHQHSSRARRPLVPVNCSAMPETLFESELFGHESGAFTGARGTRIGWFERAHQGTLFLDEIGDLPLPMQVKLLRVLQEKSIQRVGGSREIALDIRVIAATNCDLESRVKAAEFRKDLYHRLNIFVIRTPTLEEHSEDVLPLVRHFLRRIQKTKPPGTVSIEREAVAFLVSQPWPGNVRQLENVI